MKRQYIVIKGRAHRLDKLSLRPPEYFCRPLAVVPAFAPLMGRSKCQLQGIPF